MGRSLQPIRKAVSGVDGRPAGFSSVTVACVCLPGVGAACCAGRGGVPRAGSDRAGSLLGRHAARPGVQRRLPGSLAVQWCRAALPWSRAARNRLSRQGRCAVKRDASGCRGPAPGEILLALNQKLSDQCVTFDVKAVSRPVPG